MTEITSQLFLAIHLPSVHRISLRNGFTFVSVFFRFQFSKLFSSSVIFSFLLLSTHIYPSISLFLAELASLSSFFQFIYTLD